MPCQCEPRVRIGLDGLDLAAQRCERSSPQLAQHVDVTPLALDAVGPELAADDSPLGLEGRERGHDALDGRSEPGGRRSREERPVCCGIARDQVVECMLCRRGAHRGKPERNRGAEPVAQPARIVRVREPVGTADTHRDRTPRGDELVDALVRVHVGRAPRRDLVERQIAEQPQQVVHLVGVARSSIRREALQVELEVGQHARIDELAQLLGSHEIAKQVAVEGQRCRPAFGERRVVLVHVRGDPSEEEGLGERRGPGCLDRHHPDRPRTQVAQHRAQRGHVEHVLQALACRLEQHGEARVLRRDGEEVGGPLPLLPERRALTGSAAGQEQRARRALAEP